METKDLEKLSNQGHSYKVAALGFELGSFHFTSLSLSQYNILYPSLLHVLWPVHSLLFSLTESDRKIVSFYPLLNT